MTASTIRFPMRRSQAVWIAAEGPAWLVLAREHGWLFGSRREADIEARWLSSNLGLPVRGGLDDDTTGFGRRRNRPCMEPAP
jgi:hypothetical protein